LEEQVKQDEGKDLEYVDLRTENKVYYKLKEKKEDKNDAEDSEEDKKKENDN